MPQAKFSTSVLGAFLAPKIKSFLKTNADFAASLSSSSPDDGAEAIAHAIAYGVSLAWSSSIIQGAFAAGIVPPPVPPSPVTAGNPLMGKLIFDSLKPQITEP